MSNDRITLHKLIKRAQSENVMNTVLNTVRTQDFAEVIQRTTNDHKANHRRYNEQRKLTERTNTVIAR
jgi:hypothetical protein